MPPLFDKSGGFRRLHTFTLGTIIQLETLRFCRRFLTYDARDTAHDAAFPMLTRFVQLASWSTRRCSASCPG